MLWSTKGTPYLALTGELWGVFCEYLWENVPRYNGTALYFQTLGIKAHTTEVSIHLSLIHIGLTHWGRDEIDAVSQTTVSNAFPWIKMF